MQIRIGKADFLKGLYLGQSIADRKATIPAVANVLLRSEGKQSIICAATDLKVGLVAEIAAEVIEEGGISLGAKHLFEIVKGLPGEEVFLKKNENNWAEIRGGRAHYRLVGMSDRDFPRLPEQAQVEFKEVDGLTLGAMIDKTIFSVSGDETRRHLSGIYLEWVGKVLRLVSTDGHRLSKVEREVGEGLKLDGGIIVPRKAVLEIRRLLEGVEGTCEIGVSEGNLFARAGNLCLSAKLVEAQFPPYQQVVPKENDKKVVVGRVALLECLRRMSIMASERSGGIRFDLSEGVLRITSENADLGEAQEDLEVDYSGEKLSIGFNGRYFMDLLGEMENERVVMEFSGELDPGMIHPEEGTDYLGVVMPMRL